REAVAAAAEALRDRARRRLRPHQGAARQGQDDRPRAARRAARSPDVRRARPVRDAPQRRFRARGRALSGRRGRDGLRADGGAVYSPAITDFVFMVRGVSYMFVTGPSVVKTVTHEEVDFEGLGGADVHGATSGVAHFVHDSEPECLTAIRTLLSFLPSNNLD